jgi:hypothetical protein
MVLDHTNVALALAEAQHSCTRNPADVSLAPPSPPSRCLSGAPFSSEQMPLWRPLLLRADASLAPPSLTFVFTPSCYTALVYTIKAINVTNTGKVATDDAVLGFLVPPAAGVNGVPLQSLFGFDRIHLKAGETKTARYSLSFSLPPPPLDNQQLNRYDQDSLILWCSLSGCICRSRLVWISKACWSPFHVPAGGEDGR